MPYIALSILFSNAYRLLTKMGWKSWLFCLEQAVAAPANADAAGILGGWRGLRHALRPLVLLCRPDHRWQQRQPRSIHDIAANQRAPDGERFAAALPQAPAVAGRPRSGIATPKSSTSAGISSPMGMSPESSRSTLRLGVSMVASTVRMESPLFAQVTQKGTLIGDTAGREERQYSFPIVCAESVAGNRAYCAACWERQL